MTNPAEILPGVIFYSYLSSERKDKVCFWANHALVMMVSGQFNLETSGQSISIKAGEMLLIGKNQLGTLTKTPLPGQDYESIVISLQEELLRKIALEEKIMAGGKYIGPPNIQIPSNTFLQGFFQSIMPYALGATETLSEDMGILKVKEAVKLLLYSVPALRDFLFDFSDPHKIDLERFMVNNYHFNISVEKFAQLTGRSLAGFKRDFQKHLDRHHVNGCKINALTKPNILSKPNIKNLRQFTSTWALRACRISHIHLRKSSGRRLQLRCYLFG